MKIWRPTTLFTSTVLLLWLSSPVYGSTSEPSDFVPSNQQEHQMWLADQDTPAILLAQSSSRKKRRTATSRNNNNGQKATSRRGSNRSQRESRRNSSQKKNSGERQRVLTTEKRFTQKKGVGRDTSIDFDEIDITGQRKDPGVGFVRSTVGKGGRDFINIRKEWHDTMVQSTLLVD